MSSRKKGLNIYNKRRDRCKTTFSCPGCKVAVTCNQYEMQHSTSCLGLNPALQCVWCEGKVSWPNKKKNYNTNHLLACRQAFIDEINNPSQSVEEVNNVEMEDVENLTLDVSRYMCEAKKMFGRSKFPELTDRGYEPIFPFEFDEDFRFDVFRDANLNLAVDCVKLFLSGDYEFYHCMVRAVTMVQGNFFSIMEADLEVKVLPFSCWCDGGEQSDDDDNPLYRHHFHFVAIYPKTPERTFQRDVWSKIKIENREIPNAKCARKKPIESVLHLINVLGYVSKRESKCNGTFKEMGEMKLNHYWISTPLPKNFRLSLVLQWDGGILQLIQQNYKNLSTRFFVGAPSLRKADGKWKIKIKDLPDIQKGLVLLVSRSYKLVEEEDEGSEIFNLTDGRKLYFKKIDEELPEELSVEEEQQKREEWIRKQAEGGNVFYDVVGDVEWTLNPAHQKNLDAMEYLFQKIEKLEKTLEQKGTEHEKILEEKDLEHQKILEEKDLEHQKILEEKDLEHQKILKDKEVEYMQILKVKEAEYRKIFKDKEAKHRKILEKKEMEQQRMMEEERRSEAVRKRDIRKIREEATQQKKEFEQRIEQQRRDFEHHVEQQKRHFDQQKRDFEHHVEQQKRYFDQQKRDFEYHVEQQKRDFEQQKRDIEQLKNDVEWLRNSRNIGKRYKSNEE